VICQAGGNKEILAGKSFSVKGLIREVPGIELLPTGEGFLSGDGVGILNIARTR
jgi:hypothetical protein